MDFIKVLKKSSLAFLTFISAYLMINPEVVISLIPQNIVSMTVGGLVSAIIVGLNNWLKHRND